MVRLGWPRMQLAARSVGRQPGLPLKGASGWKGDSMRKGFEVSGGSDKTGKADIIRERAFSGAARIAAVFISALFLFAAVGSEAGSNKTIAVWCVALIATAGTALLFLRRWYALYLWAAVCVGIAVLSLVFDRPTGRNLLNWGSWVLTLAIVLPFAYSLVKLARLIAPDGR